MQMYASSSISALSFKLWVDNTGLIKICRNICLIYLVQTSHQQPFESLHRCIQPAMSTSGMIQYNVRSLAMLVFRFTEKMG